MPALRTSIAATGGLLLCLLCACNSGFKDISRRLARPDPASQAPQEEVRDRRRTYYDRAATRPHTETGWLLRGDGRSVKDGIERAWYENGQLEFERSWTRDEPSGLWRTWFEDGTQRFEHLYDPEQPTPMTWWPSRARQYATAVPMTPLPRTRTFMCAPSARRNGGSL